MNLFILFCFQCCPPDICCNWSEHCLDSGCCYGQRKVTHCCTRESVYKSWPSKWQCKAGGSACCCSWSYCRCQVRERQVKIFTSPWKQKLEFLWKLTNIQLAKKQKRSSMLIDCVSSALRPLLWPETLRTSPLRELYHWHLQCPLMLHRGGYLLQFRRTCVVLFRILKSKDVLRFPPRMLALWV